MKKLLIAAICGTGALTFNAANAQQIPSYNKEVTDIKKVLSSFPETIDCYSYTKVSPTPTGYYDLATTGEHRAYKPAHSNVTLNYEGANLANGSFVVYQVQAGTKVHNIVVGIDHRLNKKIIAIPGGIPQPNTCYMGMPIN